MNSWLQAPQIIPRWKRVASLIDPESEDEVQDNFEAFWRPSVEVARVIQGHRSVARNDSWTQNSRLESSLLG